MDIIKTKAPAKINFGLNIVSKREDGYHNIETVFYPVNIYDTLKIQKATDLSFYCDTYLGKAEDNLVVKAVKALESLTKTSLPCSIELKKNIPAGAGMGGGSSDAASALNTLIKLYNLNISRLELADLALSLGSDVPFFLDPIPSYAESRGESLFRSEFIIDLPILIVNPGIHVSTAWAYSEVNPAPSDGYLRSLSGKISEIDVKELKEKVINDFEKAVFNKHAEIRKIKDTMSENGALFSLMTGSGSTVFGVFKNETRAKDVMNIFPEHYFRVIC